MRWPCAPGGVVSLDWTLDILAKHPHIVSSCKTDNYPFFAWLKAGVHTLEAIYSFSVENIIHKLLLYIHPPKYQIFWFTVAKPTSYI